MGTLQADSEAKQELDDSGCVQDEAPSSKKATENGYVGQAQLLDLSDDVLLYILRHCSPRDLKALGFTCPRLGSLILDHTLWQSVDARSQPSGRARVRWLLAHAVHSGTKELMLSGYAREAKGCLGHVNRSRKECTADKEQRPTHESGGNMLLDFHNDGRGDGDLGQDGDANVRVAEPPYPLFRQHARLHFSAHQLPRLTGSPSWPEDMSETGDGRCSSNEGCAGPQFTVTQCMLRQLRMQCKELTTLCLEYCNINCKTTGINQFPPTLKKLSLRGTKCYNPPLDKSILFKIHDYLPNLEYLDVSECSWLEPASLLALSKMTSLQHLLMRHCYTMSEFVAYASLATRYGFRKLKVLDLSGSPVGDSEVSALGWIPALEELYLCPAPCSRFGEETPTHCHYKGEALSSYTELDEWETEEPEYFKIKEDTSSPTETSPDTSVEDIEDQLEKLRNIHNNMCLHGTQFNMCTDGVRVDVRSRDDDQPRVRTNTKRVQENGGSDNPEANPPGLSPKRKKPANENDSHKQNVRISDSDNSDREKDVSIKINVNEGASTSKMSAQSVDEKCTKDISQNEDKGSENNEKPKLQSHVRFTRKIPAEEKFDSDNQDKESKKCDNTNKKPNLESYLHFRRNQEPTQNDRNSDSDSDDENKKSDSKNKKHKLQSYVLFRQNQESTQNEPSSDTDDESKKSCNKNKKPKLSSYVLFRQNQEPTQNYQNEASDSDTDESKNSQKSEDIIKPIIQSYVRFTRNQPITAEEKTDSDSVESKNSQKSDNQNLKPKLESFLSFRPNQEPTQSEQNSDSDSDDENKKTDNKNKKRKLQSYVLFRQNQEPTPNVQNSDSGDSKKSDSKTESSSSYVLFRQNQEPSQNDQNDSNSSDDDSKNSEQSKEKPIKPYIRFVRNQLPQNEENSDSDETQDRPESQKSKTESYVHFRQNQQPVIVERPMQPEPIESRQHILYVNVGEQLRAVYRLHTDRREHLNIYTHHTTHVGSSSLVTDSAVRRFGRADGEDVNYVHIGPNGPYHNREVGARPDRSNLRVLSITGYRYITDRSLVHLATAAPNLRLIDFSDTGVTEQGVESFRSVRPDCEVRFSSSEEKMNRTSE